MPNFTITNKQYIVRYSIGNFAFQVIECDGALDDITSTRIMTIPANSRVSFACSLWGYKVINDYHETLTSYAPSDRIYMESPDTFYRTYWGGRNYTHNIYFWLNNEGSSTGTYTSYIDWAYNASSTATNRYVSMNISLLVHTTDGYYIPAYFNIYNVPDYAISIVNPEPGKFGYVVGDVVNTTSWDVYIMSLAYDKQFIRAFNDSLNHVTPAGGDDPYSGGGTSEPGGGDGTFGENRFGDGIDDESITVPDYDPLDQLNRSVLGSQFVNVYAPSQANIGALKGFLWSSQIGDTLKKMFNNPMDAIISLHMVPVTVPGITQNIFLGGTDTEIESTRVTNQYVTVNCGTMTIGEYWDAYLDYSPYTKLFLYLPFCGMHEVDVDEFMGQSITIRYDVDVVSGDCLCSISAARSGGLSTVLYQYAGNCSVEIPVSMANYNARISAYLGLVGSAAGVAAGIASGGLSAPLAATAVASTAANVASAKTTIQRSGAIAGSTAWMSQLKPYLILVQPTQCLPDNQAHFTGYPSFITAAVGDLSGFTSFAEIHLEGISATDSEKAEIESILKGGVLL